MATSIGDDGRYLDVNDAMLSRLGYKRDEMVGRRPAEFVTSESAGRIEKEFMPTLRRTGRLDNKPVSFVTHDGEIVRCVVNSVVEHSTDGRFVRTVAVYNEISDQAKIDRQYRYLYRSTPAMLHTVDANGAVVTVTDHWLLKMGYTRDEVVGRPVLDFYSEADRKRIESGHLEHIVAGREFDNEPRQMVTKNGQVLDLLMSALA